MCSSLRGSGTQVCQTQRLRLQRRGKILQQLAASLDRENNADERGRSRHEPEQREDRVEATSRQDDAHQQRAEHRRQSDPSACDAGAQRTQMGRVVFGRIGAEPDRGNVVAANRN